MTARYAEDASFWATPIHPAKSKAEIEELLDEFGATQQVTAKGQAYGCTAWIIRFVWQERSYRLAFTPFECRQPDKVASFGGERRSHSDQSEYQMGRIAAYCVRAILTAAKAHPHALFGFMELPETASEGGVPRTAGEMDISGVMSALPAPSEFLLRG